MTKYKKQRTILTMKHKHKHKLDRKRIKIRPMRGPIRVMTPDCPSNNDILEFISGMGYLIYEDPTDEDFLIISDRAMSYSDFKKSCLSEGSREWIEEVYGDQMDEELEMGVF